MTDPLSPGPENEFFRMPGGGPGSARDEFAALAACIGPPPTQVVPTDWQSVERELGISYPSDYKKFVAMYGAGAVCDIKVSAPGAPGEFDQFDLLRRKLEQVIRSGASEYRPPIFTEKSGMIVWGEGSHMLTLGWLPDPVSNPNNWGITISAPYPPWLSRISYRPGWSFSSFLLLLYRSRRKSPFTSTATYGRAASPRSRSAPPL